MRHGQLTFVADAPASPSGGKRGLWRCDCGVEKVILMASVNNGITRSCGCLGKKKARAWMDRFYASRRRAR